MAKYYREVPVTERLPEKEGIYVVIEENKGISTRYFFPDSNKFSHGVSPKITHWLEPVEEDVLVSVAEDAWNECETWKGWVTQTELDKKKEQYINKLKESI